MAGDRRRVTALLWWAIWFFDGTLDLAGGAARRRPHRRDRGGGAALVVPFAGLAGLRAALRARAPALDGNLTEARVAADDARQATWYVVGFGLTALILAFLFWFFGANDGRVREVLFNWQYPGGTSTTSSRASGSTSRSSWSPRSSSSCGPWSWPSCG